MQSHACKDNNRTQRKSIGQRVAMEGHGMQWKHANERERIERTISIEGEQGELREKWNKCEILRPNLSDKGFPFSI